MLHLSDALHNRAPNMIALCPRVRTPLTFPPAMR
jgi:hypothetical protein